MDPEKDPSPLPTLYIYVRACVYIWGRCEISPIKQVFCCAFLPKIEKNTKNLDLPIDNYDKSV